MLTAEPRVLAPVCPAGTTACPAMLSNFFQMLSRPAAQALSADWEGTQLVSPGIVTPARLNDIFGM